MNKYVFHIFKYTYIYTYIDTYIHTDTFNKELFFTPSLSCPYPNCLPFPVRTCTYDDKADSFQSEPQRHSLPKCQKEFTYFLPLLYIQMCVFFVMRIMLYFNCFRDICVRAVLATSRLQKNEYLQETVRVVTINGTVTSKPTMQEKQATHAPTFCRPAPLSIPPQTTCEMQTTGKLIHTCSSSTAAISAYLAAPQLSGSYRTSLEYGLSWRGISSVDSLAYPVIYFGIGKRLPI